MSNPSVYRLENPYRFGNWFDMDEAREAARSAAQTRRAMEKVYDEQVIRAADAERDLRKNMAIRLVSHRSEGKGVGEAEILAKGDTADLKHAADIAEGMKKATDHRLRGLEGERANMRQLMDWSARLRIDGREAA